MSDLRVGIMGAGSIGSYVGGRLVATGAAAVTFVGRDRIGAELAEHGLTVSDMTGMITVPPTRIDFSTESGALASSNVVLVSVKSGDTADAGRQLREVIAPDAVVVSLQNGVRNPRELRSILGNRVLAGVIEFNVVSRGRGVFHCGLTGPISLEADAAPQTRELVEAMRVAGFRINLTPDIASIQWTKLLVNLNNAVSALSGAPTRDLLRFSSYRRIVAAMVAEGINVLRAAGIATARLRGVPVTVMPLILRFPDPLARLILRSQIKVDAAARSSMWEDLERRRPTEIEFLNGEIVRLARDVAADAPLNRKIVDLIHAAEAAGTGSPGMSADQLWSELNRD